MTDLPGAVRHCLRNLATFSGRDTRSQFWFYMLALFLAQQALTVVVVIAMFVGPMGHFGDASPDPEAAFGFFHGFMLVTLAFPIFAIALVGAAVVRRLHDSNLRGWWGIMPLPFLTFGEGCMYWFFSTFGQPGVEPDDRLFFMAFTNNAIYLLTIVVLIILLVRGSDPLANRFGPPPAGDTDR